MIRKHIFGNATYPEDLAPNWIGRQCIFCNKISGLDDWQIVDMPKEMAICNKSTQKSSIWEHITGCYNCLFKSPSHAG